MYLSMNVNKFCNTYSEWKKSVVSITPSFRENMKKYGKFRMTAKIPENAITLRAKIIWHIRGGVLGIELLMYTIWAENMKFLLSCNLFLNLIIIGNIFFIGVGF